MADAYSYQGPVEPEILTEPVEFEFKIITAIAVGVVTTYTYFLVGLAFAFGICVIIGRYPNDLMLDAVLVACVGGILTAFHISSHKRDRKLVVDTYGITAFKDGIVTHRCPWSEMTLIKQRFGQCELADQQQKPFSFDGLRSKSPSQTLALNVVRTKQNQLKVPRKQKPFQVILYGLLAGVVGVLTMNFLPNYGPIFIDAIGDPSTSTIYRTQLLLLLILRELPAMGILGFAIGPSYALLYWVASLTKKNPLTQFVASKKGKLDSIEMVDGVWYRYFDQRAISKEDPLLAFAIMIIPLLFFVIGPLAISPRTSDGAILSLSCLPILILFAFGYMHVSKVRRTYFAQLRSVDGRYEIKLKEGTILSAEKLEKLKVYNEHRTTLGSVRWLLKASDGKQYVFDPRYLVPVEQGEEEYRPQHLQPVL